MSSLMYYVKTEYDKNRTVKGTIYQIGDAGYNYKIDIRFLCGPKVGKTITFDLIGNSFEEACASLQRKLMIHRVY